jgi:hypothetical protein
MLLSGRGCLGCLRPFCQPPQCVSASAGSRLDVWRQLCNRSSTNFPLSRSASCRFPVIVRTMKTQPGAADKNMAAGPERREFMNPWMMRKKDAEVEKTIANVVGDKTDPFSALITGVKVRITSDENVFFRDQKYYLSCF